MKKKATILDVARKANVSSATVSRVVNAQGGVKPETEARIIKAIEELSYVRNAIARSMVRKETKTIGVIVPDITNPFFSQVISGVEEAAIQAGFFPIVTSTREDLLLEQQILTHYLERGIDGLIITTAQENGTHLNEFMKSSIPVVAVDRPLKQYDVDTVLSGNREGAFEAVSHLIEEGFKDIAIIRGPQNTTPGLERYKGYVKALEANGIPVQPDFVCDGDFMQGSGYEQVKNLYSQKRKPDAVFSSNNFMSLGAIRAMRELDWKIGRDIGFAGFDDIEVATFMEPALTVVSRRMKHLGAIAFQYLENRMEKKGESAKREYILSPSLVIRDSSKRLR
ncbi:LacI family DNA-binding transcriptional regulator [Alkalicoccus urumqiensis]|uniref:LacI family transcriptional regulator n=1 Tax=Alkalicoccus urumqiensis TaxID=1548213 RepID=A0A2P6MLA0_ALKUR|nr:LacI family DNA-binding transcriptional regulator [Alkalicoccus urumqiensis]PRO67044.1 LacI family transcriptional regulator [Alkalicoccus urumqiensis]